MMKMSENERNYTIVIVAPRGKTNLVTRRSILRFSSKLRNVTGNVAPLKKVPQL